jgi:dienelactone hydrolase
MSVLLARAVGAADVAPLRSAPTRKPVSFKSGNGQTCWGVVHAPGTSFGRSPGVLLLHDLVGSKDAPHRMFVTLADALADAGFTSLRFDLRGRGESDGKTIDATPRSDLEDARRALEVLRQEPNLDADHFILLGHGWGGALVSLLADSPGVKRIVLWGSAPVDHDEPKVPPMRDQDGRQAADVAGNLVAQEFYDGVKELAPASVLKKVRRPVLMVHGTRDETIRQRVFEDFAADLRFADVDATLVPIDSADHAFTTHASTQQAITETVQWVRGA